MWGLLQRIFGGRAQQSHPVFTESQLQTARAIVADWGEFVEGDTFRTQIRDESELPFPKQAIHNALLIVAGTTKDPELAQAIPTAAFPLAYFQPNIGDTPLWPNGSDINTVASFMQSAGELGVELSAEALSSAMVNDPQNKARYDSLIETVRSEAAVIQEQIAKVLKAAR